MGFRLRKRARADIISIMDYIGRDNPAAASQWQRDIFRLFEILGDQPGIGTRQLELSQDIKMFPKGSYIVVFRTAGKDAHILRVVHAARDWTRLFSDPQHY